MPLNVQAGRFADVIRKRMGVQAHVGLNLVDDLFTVYPTHPVDPEDALLRDELRVALFVNVGAVAGQLGYIRLSNPAGSGRIVVLEEVVVVTGTTMLGGWDPNVGPAGNLTAYMLDGRAVGTRHNSGSVQSGTAAASTLGVTQFIFSTATVYRPGVVLLPGNCFGMFGQAVNVAVSASLMWREFVPTDEEMRG